jgi:hypothetical protein
MIQDNNLTVCLQNFKFHFVNNDGRINYSTACAIPSSTKKSRVWNILIGGVLFRKKCNRYVLEGDFSDVISQGYSITFTGRAQGNLNVGDKVLNASNRVNYKYNSDSKKLILEIKTNEFGLFELNININDDVSDFTYDLGTVLP